MNGEFEFRASEESNSLVVESTKFLERRTCGCTWLYLANQPVVAPCAEHLAKLKDGDDE